MDTSSILPLPQLSFLSLRLNRNKASWPCNLQRSSRSTGTIHCQKMYVPGGQWVTRSFCTYLRGFADNCYVITQFAYVQDLERHHQKPREPNTSTISSLTLLLGSSPPSFRFLQLSSFLSLPYCSYSTYTSSVICLVLWVKGNCSSLICNYMSHTSHTINLHALIIYYFII